MTLEWSVRLLRAILYGLIGAVVVMIPALMFIAIWTAVFKRVPLNQVWQYMQQRPPYAVFVTAFVATGIVVGLTFGVVKGLRGR